MIPPDRPTLRRRSARLRVVVFLGVCVCLAGWALRLALVGYHGLEGDDGFSLALARLPLAQLVAGTLRLELDIHPPLSFVVLKAWTALTGETLTGVRTLNLLFDLVTGAAVMRLARLAAGASRRRQAQAAVAAGLLWAGAPLLIYAGWLARMYSLLAALVAFGTLCLLALLQAARRRRSGVWAFGLGVCALAALYTHITAVVAVAAWACLALFAFVQRERARAAWALGALAGAGAAWLPFAVPALAVYRSGRTLGASVNTSQFGALSEIPGTLFGALVLHRETALGGVLLAGLIGLAALRGRRAAAPLGGVVAVMLAGMTALAALDFYKPRYLAPFVAPMLALTAALLVGGRAARTPRQTQRSSAAVALALGALVSVLYLSAWRADLDRARRDDFAAAAAFVAAHERPDETVIVIPDWGAEAFRFHYSAAGGRLPVTGVFPQLNAGVDYAPTLRALTAGTGGVWFVSYQPEVSDRDGLAAAFFETVGVPAFTVYPAGMRITRYVVPTVAALPAAARPLDVRFGGLLALRGASVALSAGSATDTRLHPPSRWLHVTLYWEALSANTHATPQVRLTNPAVWGAALTTPNPTLARFPVATWTPGTLWQVDETINVNPAAPPGVYALEVMVLDADGVPLAAAGRDAGSQWAIVGTFTVEG